MKDMINEKVRKMAMILFLSLAIGCLSSCSDDDDSPSVAPSASGVVQDMDGNEYHWVRIGNLDWMTDNLRCGTPFYEDAYNDKWGRRSLSLPNSMETSKLIYDNFGNYYSWQEAMDNAPEGWRLPTDDDWKNLERALGMRQADIDKEGWRSGCSYLMTQDGEGSQLNMRYGGSVYFLGYSLSINHYYDFGYYWSATSTSINGEPAAYARMITPSRNAVNRLQVMQEEHFMSVRYVRDAQ